MVSNTKAAIGRGKRPPDGDFGVLPSNSEARQRTERLRQAVRQAGGNKAVADRASLPIGTLNNYLAGREMKASAMIALATACNVPLEWLATGQGSMTPAVDAPPASAPPEHLKLFGTIDMQRMATALETAVAAFNANNASPSWQRIAQVATLIYDALGEPDAKPRELANALSTASEHQQKS